MYILNCSVQGGPVLYGIGGTIRLDHTVMRSSDKVVKDAWRKFSAKPDMDGSGQKRVLAAHAATDYLKTSSEVAALTCVGIACSTHMMLGVSYSNKYERRDTMTKVTITPVNFINCTFPLREMSP